MVCIAKKLKGVTKNTGKCWFWEKHRTASTKLRTHSGTLSRTGSGLELLLCRWLGATLCILEGRYSELRGIFLCRLAIWEGFKLLCWNDTSFTWREGFDEVSVVERKSVTGVFALFPLHRPKKVTHLPVQQRKQLCQFTAEQRKCVNSQL